MFLAKKMKFNLQPLPINFDLKYLKNYKIIACPGCYPTSILLPLLPLLKNNLVSEKNIIIDSKSGFSGAGRGVHKLSLIHI